MATSERSRKRLQDMERTLALLAQGKNIAETMEHIGRERSTYNRWRKESPEFAARADAINARLRPRHRRATMREAIPDPGYDISTFEGHRKRFFGYDTYNHQQQMTDAINGAAPGSVTMILMPPEWMKTTTLTDWICKLIGDDPNRRICYITESLSLSEKVLGRVQRRMTDRSIAADYIDTFGPFKAPERAMQKPWNKQYMTVLRSTHDEADYTMEARGSTSNIYGSRYDDEVIDDIQSHATATVVRSKTLLDRFRQDWRTRVNKSGRIFIIGTRVGVEDFYILLLREGLVDNVVIIPALDEHGKSNFPAVYNEDGTRACSEGGDPLGWTEAELAERRRQVGEDVWWRVYMQTGRATGAGPFTESIVERAFDNDRAPGRQATHARPFGRLGGVDPALGGHAGFALCSYDGGALFLEEIRDRPGLQRTEEIFENVEEMTIEHLPDEWVWEVNGVQGGFARDDDNWKLRDKYGFTVTEHNTGDNKLDPKIGVPSMASAMSRGEIRLPGTPEGREMCALLVEELLQWRQEIPAKLLRQDLVMALWFVYLRWQQVRAAINSSLEDFNRTGSSSYTPYQTTLGGWR